jgi:hypothetical protein
MLEDFRNHDPRPTEQECAWMAVNPFSVLVRVVALASLAAAIGLAASYDVNPQEQPTAVAVSSAP